MFWTYSFELLLVNVCRTRIEVHRCKCVYRSQGFSLPSTMLRPCKTRECDFITLSALGCDEPLVLCPPAHSLWLAVTPPAGRAQDRAQQTSCLSPTQTPALPCSRLVGSLLHENSSSLLSISDDIFCSKRKWIALSRQTISISTEYIFLFVFEQIESLWPI